MHDDDLVRSVGRGRIAEKGPRCGAVAGSFRQPKAPGQTSHSLATLVTNDSRAKMSESMAERRIFALSNIT